VASGAAAFVVLVAINHLRSLAHTRFRSGQ
jgi:hypothetical protein